MFGFEGIIFIFFIDYLIYTDVDKVFCFDLTKKLFFLLKYWLFSKLYVFFLKSMCYNCFMNIFFVLIIEKNVARWTNGYKDFT